MGWFSGVSKSLGWKNKSYSDLTQEEKNKALMSLKKSMRKTEQKIDQGEKELLALGVKVIESTKPKSAIFLEQIKQKKMLMNVYTKKYISIGRNANALETCIEFEQILGAQFNKHSKDFEALSPNNLITVMAGIKDAVDDQAVEGEGLADQLRQLGEEVNPEEDTDILHDLERIQDELIDNESLSVEEKAKMLIDKA